MRVALALSFVAVACSPDAPSASADQGSRTAIASPEASRAIAAAEQRVREMLENPQELAFSQAEYKDRDGVALVCGRYEHRGVSNRYVDLGGEMTMLEERAAAYGFDMERDFAAYCRW